MSMKDLKIKLVIFDLDGTLLDTIADLGNAVNHTLQAYGLPMHEITAYRMMVGRGMRNLVKAALPEDRREDAFVDPFLKEFLDYYMKHVDDATLPYPGIPELVSKLHKDGYKIAVASNKLQAGTEALIRKFFPGIPFAAVCGNKAGCPLKPDAALVNKIMEEAGAQRDNTVMVGDSEIDIQTARNAGIRAIAVSWGFRPEECLKEADRLARSAEDVLDMLESGMKIE